MEVPRGTSRAESESVIVDLGLFSFQSLECLLAGGRLLGLTLLDPPLLGSDHVCSND